MDERRQHSRHATELQLEVFELHSGHRLGRIVDLSRDGFMLFGETPPRTDTLIECGLVSEQPVEGIGEIRLVADCLWSRLAADDRHCWAGFHIIDLAPDQAAALEVLLGQL